MLHGVCEAKQCHADAETKTAPRDHDGTANDGLLIDSAPRQPAAFRQPTGFRQPTAFCPPMVARRPTVARRPKVIR
ncbi:hypothetical protein FJT64_015013 [Amphibalanus amphitrite]|uniref:Uncharacterized protein n=1 Tax=Amphibalanus amphitrite TaxID=1232801 RepID=A0A6A4XHS3_AMPAM|nr:hypothetical protein FJT64_015013 [Amphibalanus amphitrite]